MTDAQLPEGWVWKKLGEVSSILGGGTPARQEARYFGGNIVWLTPTEIDKKNILSVNSSREQVTEEGLKNSSARIIPAGSVLLTSRASIGFVAIAGCDLTTNQGFASFITNPETFNLYLAYWLKSKKKLLEEKATGTTFKEIAKAILKTLEIPLPPLPVQRQIVARIEELFSELDAGVSELQTALTRLKTYRQAVLHHYLDNPDWERVKLGEVCKVISGNAFKSSDFVDSGIPVVKISNVGYSEYVDKNQEYLPPSFLLSYSPFKVGAKDLLFALTRPITNDTTKVCYYPDSEPDGLLNQRVSLINPLSTLCKGFLFYYMQSNNFKKYIKSKFTETLQPNLSPNDLKKTDIPLPDLETQNQIVTEIETKLSEADAMETAIRQELLRAEKLRQSILKRAFAGQLVVNAETPLVGTAAEKSASIVTNQLSLF